MFMETDEREITELVPASLGRVLKRGVVDAWDRFGLVIGASLVWSFAVSLPIIVAAAVGGRIPGTRMWLALVGLAASALVGAALLGGIYRLAYKIVYREDPTLGDVLSGAKEMVGRSYAIAAINVIVAGILALDVAFFFGLIGPLRTSLITLGVGALALYAMLAWSMAAIYQFPLLSAQRPMGQREGALAAVKKSLLLALHNPGFTIGLFVVILGFSVLCLISVIGMLVIYTGTVSIVTTHALRELYVRYGVVEEPPEVEEDEGWSVN